MYERLKTICKEKNTTITYVCEQVTGNKGNLQTWKKDYMRSDWLSKVADMLDVSTDYLLGRTEEPTQQIMNNNGEVTRAVQAHTYNEREKEFELDEISAELLEQFRKLSFKDKAEIMIEINKRLEG